MKDFRELEDQKFLVDNKIESIFCIAYYSRDFALIRPHLKTLLKEYGGWIGNDEDGFQPCFDLEDSGIWIISRDGVINLPRVHEHQIVNNPKLSDSMAIWLLER